jgi:transposase
MQAASIIAMIGNIANFDRPAQLKSYFGWAPTLTQSGKTLDHAKLTPRGIRVMKGMIYLIVLQLVHLKDNEFARSYERLVLRKCAYDERRKQYIGKNKVIGRIAGQLIGIIFTLLKRDQEVVAKGGNVLPPERYDPEIHHQHRSGHYQPATQAQPGHIVQLPVQ